MQENNKCLYSSGIAYFTWPLLVHMVHRINWSDLVPIYERPQPWTEQITVIQSEHTIFKLIWKRFWDYKFDFRKKNG